MHKKKLIKNDNNEIYTPKSGFDKDDKDDKDNKSKKNQQNNNIETKPPNILNY